MTDLDEVLAAVALLEGVKKVDDNPPTPKQLKDAADKMHKEYAASKEALNEQRDNLRDAKRAYRKAKRSGDPGAKQKAADAILAVHRAADPEALKRYRQARAAVAFSRWYWRSVLEAGADPPVDKGGVTVGMGRTIASNQPAIGRIIEGAR